MMREYVAAEPAGAAPAAGGGPTSCTNLGTATLVSQRKKPRPLGGTLKGALARSVIVSPVPTYSMRGFVGASASAPIGSASCGVPSGAHVSPAFRVTHTPPQAVPAKMVAGFV